MKSNMHSAFNFVQSVLRNYKWSSEWIERLGWITKTEQTKRERTNELVNWPIRHKCESNGNSVEMPIYFKFYDYFLEFRLWLACTVVRQKRPTNIFYALSFSRRIEWNSLEKLWCREKVPRTITSTQHTSIYVAYNAFCVCIMCLQVAVSLVSEWGRRSNFVQC